MARRLVLKSLLAAGVLLTAPSFALAQSPTCDRYRAELASLGRGGDAGAAASARRLRSEVGRLQSAWANMRCDRGQFLFFGEPRPAQCNGIEAQLGQLQAQLGQAVAQSGGSDSRRRQLQAAIRQNCEPGAAPAAVNRQPNFLERLFGGQPAEPSQENDQPGRRSLEEELPDRADGDPNEQRQQRYGGSRVVCVRTCDGYFFPLPSNGRDGAGEMCQALCPATETQVFFMPADGRIERAGNREGRPYTDLPNASKYSRSFDPACACRKSGESWSIALQRAEELLKHNRNDIIVTAEKAEELSRPKVAARKPDAKSKQAAPVEAAFDPEPEAIDPASVPTASHESSGIGPQTIPGQETVSAGEGQVRELRGADGSKQSVRVVAPGIFASPTTPTRAQ